MPEPGNEHFNQFIEKELADFERCHLGVDAYIVQKHSCPQCGQGLDYKGFSHKVDKALYMAFMLCHECDFWNEIK